MFTIAREYCDGFMNVRVFLLSFRQNGTRRQSSLYAVADKKHGKSCWNIPRSAKIPLIQIFHVFFLFFFYYAASPTDRTDEKCAAVASKPVTYGARLTNARMKKIALSHRRMRQAARPLDIVVKEGSSIALSRHSASAFRTLCAFCLSAELCVGAVLLAH